MNYLARGNWQSVQLLHDNVPWSAGTVNWNSKLSEENYQLLQIQNPRLAAEELWAHVTPHIETGGLLLSTRDAPLILDNDTYWQVRGSKPEPDCDNQSANFACWWALPHAHTGSLQVAVSFCSARAGDCVQLQQSELYMLLSIHCFMTFAAAQVVILLVQHSAAGSVGLILNRPSGLRMGVGKGGLPMPIIGAPQGMQEVFADNRLYCGGLVRQDVSSQDGL